MSLIYKCLVITLLLTCANSLIIPDEITSLLSLIYSNIPPINKGTDSRVGLGFALGRHADFQVVLELGPQTNTEPLGNSDSQRRRQSTVVGQPNSGDSQRRRQATVATTAGNAVAPTRWLTRWNNALRANNLQKSNVVSAPAKLRRVEEASPPDSSDVMAHLHQLYKNNGATSSTTSTTTTS